jgi:hypothetical protein
MEQDRQVAMFWDDRNQRLLGPQAIERCAETRRMRGCQKAANRALDLQFPEHGQGRLGGERTT